MFDELISDQRIAQFVLVPAGTRIAGEIIGSAPDRNPALTDAGRGTIYMLQSSSGALGHLPGPLMANNSPGNLNPGIVAAHECGHLRHLWKFTIFESSNDTALGYENAARRLQNLNAPLRKHHNYPRQVGG